MQQLTHSLISFKAVQITLGIWGKAFQNLETLLGFHATQHLGLWVHAMRKSAALYNYANESNEKAETQSRAHGMGTQLQKVKFVFLLNTSRKIFKNCTLIMVTMHKTTVDAIQLTLMINNLKGY